MQDIQGKFMLPTSSSDQFSWWPLPL